MRHGVRRRTYWLRGVEWLEDRSTPNAGVLDPAFGTAGLTAVTNSEFLVTPDARVPGSGAGTVVGVLIGGGVIVGGEVSAVNSDVNHFASGFAFDRLTADGKPDGSYGTRGHAYVYLNKSNLTGFSGRVNADGSVVFAGITGQAQSAEAVSIYRLTPAGDTDPSFGPDGQRTVPVKPPSAEMFDPDGGRPITSVLPDGSVIAIGGRTSTSHTLTAARVTAAGVLDPTFGSGGVMNDALDTAFRPVGLAVGGDGGVVVAGWDTAANGASVFAAVRVTPGGKLDATFGSGGEAKVAVGQSAQATTLVVQPDGSVLLAGPAAVLGTSVVATARLTKAGAPDPAYGTAGQSVFAFGASSTVSGVSRQADGSVVLAGTSDGQMVVARVTAAGVLDQTFGGGGVTTTSATLVSPDYFNTQGSAVTARPDGRFVVSGAATQSGFGTDMVVAQLADDSQPPALSLAPTTIPALTAGVALDLSLGATGGAGAVTYAVTAGKLPDGLTLAADGRLSGVPAGTAANGFHRFTVTATDSLGRSVSQYYSPAVQYGPAVLNVTSLSDKIAKNYTEDTVFSAPGPYGPVGTYTYQLSSPTFAPADGSPAIAGTDGLILNNGKLSGSPTAAGTLTFTVTAAAADTPEGPVVVSRAFAIHVLPNPLLFSPDLGETLYFHAGTAATTTITVTSPTPLASLDFLDFGIFPTPPGLTMTTDLGSHAATISGTPTATGPFQIFLFATDAAGVTNGGTYAVHVLDASTLELTGDVSGSTSGQADLPFVNADGSPKWAVRANGATDTVSFRVASGSLPPGLTLQTDPSTGRAAAAGTPTTAGEFTGSVLATDALGRHATVLFDFVIAPAAVPGVAVSPDSLPAASAGAAYSQQLTATGGTGTKTFSLADGNLPPGLVLTGNGLLSGTPTAAGYYTFTVAAGDSGGATGRRAYGIGVLPAQRPLAVASAAGGADIGSDVPALRVGFVPWGVTVDAAGNVFVTDENHFRIRRIDAATGMITSVAGRGGNGILGGEGVPATGVIVDPTTVAVDAAGNLYFNENGYDLSTRVYNIATVRKVDAKTGAISTIAGSTPGFSGDGGPAVRAQLDFPTAVTVDGAGNVYIGETGNGRVRRIDAVTGVITTVAGGGTALGDGGPATGARFDQITAIAMDAAGNLYVTDRVQQRVRRVDAATGIVTTVAGNGTRGFSGDGGPAVAAQLALGNPSYFPDSASGLAVDAQGNVYIADTQNARVRRVDAVTGVITTVAGGGTAQSYDGEGGPAASATLKLPYDVEFDRAGNLIITDAGFWRVLVVDARTHAIRTIGGTGGSNFGGDGGPSAAAALSRPAGAVTDAAGNVYVADSQNHVVRRIDAATRTITTVAGTGTYGFDGDGGPATAARLGSELNALAMDSHGNLYISDPQNFRIRRVDAVTGVITTVAGNGNRDISGDGGPATAAGIGYTSTLVLDAAGNLYFGSILLGGSYFIRRVDAVTGAISTVAGTGNYQFNGDGSPALQTNMWPTGLAVDPAGNLIVADEFNNRVRRIDRATGIVTTIAGTGQSGYGGDDGPATEAKLYGPAAVAFDREGNLYIVDRNNNRVRKVFAATGLITTVADRGTGASGFSGPGSATAASFFSPAGLAFDPNGNIYAPDGDLLVLEIFPTIDQAPPPVGQAGVTYSASFRPPGIIATTYTAVGLPVWASLDPATGVVSGTPPETGRFTFTIRSAVGTTLIDSRQATIVIRLPQAIAFTLTGIATYGTPPIDLTAAGGGSGIPVTFTVVSGPGTVTGSTLTITGAGDIVIEANQAGNSDYGAATPVRQTLHVDRATLLVTADSFALTAGNPFPALTYSVTGFVAGDTAAVLSGELATAATPGSDSGDYEITLGTLSAANYTIAFTPGHLLLAPTSTVPPTSPPASPPTNPPTSPPATPPTSPPVSAPTSPPAYPPTSPPTTPPVSPPPVVPPSVPPPVPVSGQEHVYLRAVGTDAGGGPRVRVFRPDGSTSLDFFALEPRFTGGIRVATGDVNGDGVDDVLTAAGDGGGPRVVIFDGRTGAVLRNFFAFEDTLRVGAFVAAADVNGDGFADYTVTAGAGGGSRVVLYDGKTGDRLSPDFFAFDPAARGGFTVALGDVTGDGLAEIVVGQFAGGSTVRAFDLGGRLLGETPVYEPTFLGGVNLSSGDFDGDGTGDVIVGPGVGGGPRVRAFRVGATGEMTEIGNGFSFDSATRDGVRVGAAVTGDRSLIVAGFAGRTRSATAGVPVSGDDAPFGEDYRGGVWVS